MMWFFHTVVCPKDEDGMVNSVNPDQTDQGLHCLPIRVYTVYRSGSTLFTNQGLHCLPIRVYTVYRSGSTLFTDQGVHCLLIRVYTVYHSILIFRAHNCMEKPHRSSFRIITALGLHCLPRPVSKSTNLPEVLCFFVLFQFQFEGLSILFRQVLLIHQLQHIVTLLEYVLKPIIYTHYYNSNLIWQTVSHQVDERMP